MAFLATLACLLPTSFSGGQVVINETAYDSSPNATRFAEYVELYNAGATPVDISGWMLSSVTLDDGLTFFTDTIPGGTTLAAGDFYVLGATGVPNVDLDLGNTVDLWPNANTVLELKDASSNLVDALAYETNKGSQLLTSDQIAQVAGGWWGNTQNYNTSFPISLGRYLDGRDTNNSGRDFAVIPATPGATNGLPQTANYTLPDVDGLSAAANDPAPGFGGSFTLARTIDPTVVDSINLDAIPVSPQGGNAIIAWDESGGGNMNFSTELVNNFDIYAYIDTEFYGTPGTADVPGAETTTYGIGTTGSLHNSPDPTGLFFGDVSTANGNTGIGWVIQKEDSASLNRAMLVDFNDGGPSNPASGDWTVLESIELSGEASGWYRVSIDYDPTTGDFTARFGDQTFNHTTVTDLLGTFFIGYRESLVGTPDLLRPPTFDLVEEEPGGLVGDYNGDGAVNLADYTVWRDNLGADGSALLNRDSANVGPVGAGDYASWKSQFGATSALATAATTAIPEPSAGLLLAVLLSAATMGRYRNG